MEGLQTLIAALLRSALAHFRSRHQQLPVYSRTKRKPRLRPLDGAFWTALRGLWPCWKEVLVIAEPATVVR